MTIFNDGLNAEELAMALGMAEEIAEEERERFQCSQEEESFAPEDDEESDDDDLEGFEQD